MALFQTRNGGTGKSVTQLESEYKQLELINMTLTDQMETFRKMSFKYQDDYNKLAKRVSAFCYLLLDGQYAKDQLGGGNSIKDKAVFELMEYTEQQHRLLNQKEREFLIGVSTQIQQKNQEIEGLKAQLSRYILKERQLKMMADDGGIPEPDEDETPAPPKGDAAKTAPDLKPFASSRPSADQDNKPNSIMRMAVIDDDDDVSVPTTPSAPPAPSRQPDEKKSPVQRARETIRAEDRKRADEVKPVVQTVVEDAPPKEDPILSKLKETIEQKTEQKQQELEVLAHVVDLKTTIAKIDEKTLGWDVIEAIGTHGLSEQKDIGLIIANSGKSTSSLRPDTDHLLAMDVIEREQINVGRRWFFAYELTDLGSRIYLEKYKRSPVECEKQILKKQHTTALHGYCIKDTANVMTGLLGYDEASTDRRTNSMKLYNGQTYIPDVIAKKKDGAVVDYIEVELGHHTQKDFNIKCDKMRMVSKNLFFVVPDAETMHKILVKQIGQWVLEKGGKEKLKGTTIHLTPLKSLDKGRWETIYPF